MLPILLLAAFLYCALPFVIVPAMMAAGIFPSAPDDFTEQQAAALQRTWSWPILGWRVPDGAIPFLMILWPYVLAVYLFEWRRAGREIEKHTETWRDLNARLEVAGDELPPELRNLLPPVEAASPTEALLAVLQRAEDLRQAGPQPSPPGGPCPACGSDVAGYLPGRGWECGACGFLLVPDTDDGSAPPSPPASLPAE